jgi:FkbM family methyltransferase
MSLLKRLAAALPLGAQLALKHYYCRFLMSAGRFGADEPEYDLLGSVVRPGDWVLDIGANIGQYTYRLSDLVGPSGRVFALEPLPQTFGLLVANARRFPHPNVTLLAVAASDQNRISDMAVPRFDSGLPNYYRAQLTASGSAGTPVFCMRLDRTLFPKPVSLVKIDAEGHDHAVVRGMTSLLARDHPLVIVEDDSTALAESMLSLGYVKVFLPGSPNRIYGLPALLGTLGLGSATGGALGPG